MANITIEQIIKYTATLKDWKSIGESSADECLVIEFKRRNEADIPNIVDDEMVHKTLYLQSRNGHVAIDFDDEGLIKNIEIV